jgi:hypothetical protein
MGTDRSIGSVRSKSSTVRARECGNPLTFDLANIDICQRGHMEMDIATDLAATGLIAGDVDPSELVVPDRELM